MKHIKRIAAAVLALCALLALTACGGLQEKVESKLWETAAPILVQGNMDLLYKGVCDENYLCWRALRRWKAFSLQWRWGTASC